jgi:hypothetical protein
MTNDRKGAAVRVSQQALRQRRDERCRRERGCLAGVGQVLQELVGIGSARTETGECKGDQAIDICVIADVRCGEKVRRSGVAEARPVWHNSAP